MKEYTSCFIGIPLPQSYQSEFEQLLTGLEKVDPNLETAYPDTPHVTGYYLDKQSQAELPAIAEQVQSLTRLLRNSELVIGGFGYFRGDDPKVLFLNVKYPDAFREFNEKMTEGLAKYYAPDNNLPFQPHLTVARLRTAQAQESFRDTRADIVAKLDQVKWQFQVSEVALYGVDSTKSPQYQEKLIVIPVN